MYNRKVVFRFIRENSAYESEFIVNYVTPDQEEEYNTLLENHLADLGVEVVGIDDSTEGMLIYKLKVPVGLTKYTLTKLKVIKDFSNEAIEPTFQFVSILNSYYEGCLRNNKGLEYDKPRFHINVEGTSSSEPVTTLNYLIPHRSPDEDGILFTDYVNKENLDEKVKETINVLSSLFKIFDLNDYLENEHPNDIPVEVIDALKSLIYTLLEKRLFVKFKLQYKCLTDSVYRIGITLVDRFSGFFIGSTSLPVLSLDNESKVLLGSVDSMVNEINNIINEILKKPTIGYYPGLFNLSTTGVK